MSLGQSKIKGIAKIYNLETIGEHKAVERALEGIADKERKGWETAHHLAGRKAVAAGKSFEEVNEALLRLTPWQSKSPFRWQTAAIEVIEQLKEQAPAPPIPNPSKSPARRKSEGPDLNTLQGRREYYHANRETLLFMYRSKSKVFRQTEQGTSWENGLTTYYGTLDPVQDHSYALLRTTLKTFIDTTGTEYQLPDPNDKGIYVSFGLLDVVKSIPEALPRWSENT